MYRFDCLVDAYYVRRRPDVLLITGYLSVIAMCEVSERRLCVDRSTDSGHLRGSRNVFSDHGRFPEEQSAVPPSSSGLHRMLVLPRHWLRTTRPAFPEPLCRSPG